MEQTGVATASFLRSVHARIISTYWGSDSSIAPISLREIHKKRSEHYVPSIFHV